MKGNIEKQTEAHFSVWTHTHTYTQTFTHTLTHTLALTHSHIKLYHADPGLRLSDSPSCSPAVVLFSSGAISGERETGLPAALPGASASLPRGFLDASPAPGVPRSLVSTLKDTISPWSQQELSPPRRHQARVPASAASPRGELTWSCPEPSGSTRV